MTTPRLTDRAALSRARSRACATQGGMADFLHRMMADEVEERLHLVNRTFTDAAVISGFPALWSELRPDAKQVSDDETLGLDLAAHDLVIHAMALHWADDPVGQLAQARHALRPDGFFLGFSFGGETLTELRQVLAMAETEVMGGLSPRVAPMGEIRDLGGLLQRAGLALPVVDSLPLTVTYETMFHLMRDLRAMGEVNALANRHKAPVPREFFLKAAEDYARQFGTEDGRIRATFEILVMTGWAPDASQPQPLRPGSATTRLADALGAEEIGLNDPAGQGRIADDD
ncbi:SAM-dependent methyltransferase [Aliiruegeria sabulilitoris]|uniref:SAM-dependent methyltransferase n=1 Tax=Aliiruegeria sabulilitoris TaxID=1510458 RepID=UPI0008318A2A|nr:SAM-dependent methyltransferase [Aliiruegeria sabulilitoris]NDR57495.1 SAM-dependent methyltransferase [Pseudoruegeria sp. M32A2M]